MSEREQEAVRFATILALSVMLVAAAALLARNALGSPIPWLNHDVAFLDYAGQRLLGPDRLYVEVQEMNPPGSHYLHAALMAVAGMLGVSPFLVTQLFVMAVGAAGLAWIAHSLRGRDGAGVFALVALAYVLLLVRGNFSNNITPSVPWIPYDFGQREHLFCLLFVPYLLARVVDRLRWRPWLLPLLLLLGYVSMYKPYWPPMILAVEALRWRREGRPDLAVGLTLAVGMCLPQLILLLESGTGFVAFWTEVVPYVLGGSYSSYEAPFLDFARSPLHLQMSSAGILFVVCWSACWRGRSVDRTALAWLAGLVIWTYLSKVHQGKYWSYHGIPYFACVVVLGCFLLGRWLQSLASRPRRLGLAGGAGMLLIVCASSLFNLGWMLSHYPPRGAELIPLIEGRDKVMFFATGGDYLYAPLRSGTKLAGPWLEHFNIPVQLAVDDPRERRSGLDAYGSEIRAVIRAERPELLLFAPLKAGLPPGVHIHDILATHGAIPGDLYERWDRPRSELQTVGWVFYRRRPLETPPIVQPEAE